MKKTVDLELFILKTCPFCIRVQSYLEQLLKEDAYQNITIKEIDEAQDVAYANAHDYYLVPTFYFKDQKLLEGRMSKDDVEKVLNQALLLAQG